jgi:hypothetical protein
LQPGKNGKVEPKKVGMAPVFRDGIEYESTVFLDLDVDHNAKVSKTRCAAIDGQTYHKPGRDLARPLLDWLAGGAPVPLAPEEAPGFASDEDRRKYMAALSKAIAPASYDDYAAYCEAHDMGRPSSWVYKARVADYTILTGKDSPRLADFRTWLAAQTPASDAAAK